MSRHASNIRSPDSGEEEEGEISRQHYGTNNVATSSSSTIQATTPSAGNDDGALKTSRWGAAVSSSSKSGRWSAPAVTTDRYNPPLPTTAATWGSATTTSNSSAGGNVMIRGDWQKPAAPSSRACPPPPRDAYRSAPSGTAPFPSTSFASRLPPASGLPPHHTLPPPPHHFSFPPPPTTLPPSVIGVLPQRQQQPPPPPPPPFKQQLLETAASANHSSAPVKLQADDCADSADTKQCLGSVDAVESTVTIPLPPTANFITCASLGTGDLKVIKRAENAVLKLSKLLGLPDERLVDINNGELLLPTKDQIVKGLADIEIQIKQLNNEKQKIALSMEAAKQRQIKREEEELARKEKEELERIEEEKKKREALELKLQAEIAKKKEEEMKKLEIQTELENLLTKTELSLKELKNQKEQEMNKLTLQFQVTETELEAKWRPKIEKKMIFLRQAKETLHQSKVLLTNARSILQENTKQGEFLYDSKADSCMDDSEKLASILSSVTNENRKRAQLAHWNALSECLPLSGDIHKSIARVTPLLVNDCNNGSNDSAVPKEHDESAAFVADDTNSEDELTPVSNDEWTSLTRRIMSPADALYVDPMDSLFWEYHEQRHHLFKDLILEKVRMKKVALNEYFQNIALEYLALQAVWKNKKKGKMDDHQLTENLNADPDCETITDHQEGYNKASGTAAHLAALHASYRRNRRPLRGSSSSTCVRGLGDVVRSEYEQELIIKELTEKEALEKRIKHGGCELPRQVSSLERKLLVSYRVDFTPKRVADVLGEERDIKHINPWTDMEKCIFFDRFLLFPKDFKKIASFLRNKTTMDCVAFYYDAKKSLPFKAALREHLQRRKRGRTPDTVTVSWTATVQAAISVGASVSEGDFSDDRPFLFSTPESDNTYSTSKFHPMQREIFDLSRMNSHEYSALVPSKNPNLNAHRISFLLDNSKLFNSSEATEDASSDFPGTKRRLCAQGASLGGSKGYRSSFADSVHTSKIIAESEETTEAPQEDTQSSSEFANGPRKMPQKWAPNEKKIFFETMQQRGKDWPALVAAVGNKTLQQVKNFYYDSNKKQASKHYGHHQKSQNSGRQSPGDHASLRDSPTIPPEVEESSTSFLRGRTKGDGLVPIPSADIAADVARFHANNHHQRTALPTHMHRENQMGGAVSSLHSPYPLVDRVGQNAHHDFISNLNANPWAAAAAAQQLIQQSRDPCLRIRDAWALEASIRQQQQQFQQMAFAFGGQPSTTTHFPREILNHIRASAGYTSPVPFMNTSSNDAQAALAALSQITAARNLAAVSQVMTSRSEDPSGSSAGYGDQLRRDADYGNDSSSQS